MIVLIVILGIIFYGLMIIFVNALYQRQSLKKYGLTLKERIKKTISPSEAYKLLDEESNIFTLSVFWILIPIIYLLKYFLKYAFEFLVLLVENIDKLHTKICYFGFHDDASTKNSDKGKPYR